MTRHVVATVDEIPPGGRKLVTVAGRELGVFNLGGRFFALRNRCPHQGGPLCQGRQVGALTSAAPGEYRFERDGEILRCPWHQWEFDIRTGRSWFDPARVRVRAYDTQVAPGAALAARAPAEADDPPAPGLRPGPYTAETYPVSVERDYVVVDLGR